MTQRTVTIFRNIKDTEQPFYRDCSVVLNRIKIGSSKELIIKIRSEKEKSDINRLKQELPAICFSGKFTKRNDKSISQHSGVICLDFDGYKTKKEMNETKEALSKDEFTHSVFISPSGNGLKVLVKIPNNPDNHVNYFLALKDHYNSEYFDVTSKNISRVCYESYDPKIYVNEDSSVWTDIKDNEYKELEKYKDTASIPITDENKIVNILTKWWNDKYPMVEGQRNHNVYVLASAFNDFGIGQTLAKYVLSRYETKDFNSSEIDRTISSAYSNSQNFGTKFYEDEEKLNSIRSMMRRGISKKEAVNQLVTSKIDGSVAEIVVGQIEKEISSKKFWSRSDRGIIKIIPIMFKKFLEDNGFYKFYPDGSENYVFVRVTNNIIDHTTDGKIKDYILNYLLELSDDDVYNHFAEKTKYFKEDFLTLLSNIDAHFIIDDKSSAFLYYRNSAVKVSNNGIEMVDYLDLGGYVWKDHLIDRDYNTCDVSSCDFSQFISNVCFSDDVRIRSMESTIGFLLHGYKGAGFCPSVILNDEVISENPEGGTGKGLIMNALGHLKKVVVIDGKAFNFEKSFPYQLVSADTQIIVFDDVKKHFDFERLFSIITEGITLEKKNKDAIKIPFSTSPKVSITTNYAIKGTGNSFARRKWELELHQYYKDGFTPLDEFGKVMFTEWDKDQWCQFDNYMVGCIKTFLSDGLIKCESINKHIKDLATNTSHDFADWCGALGGEVSDSMTTLINGGSVLKQSLYNEFTEDNPDYSTKGKHSISRIKFYKWIAYFCKQKGQTDPDVWRDANGKWIRLRTKHELEKNEEFIF
jgi:hypothetical protein|tara:strand:+ start:3042 stop:5468 length:2427 start_codon:yes stop_codon:yes gene_type:complete